MINYQPQVVNAVVPKSPTAVDKLFPQRHLACMKLSSLVQQMMQLCYLIP